MMNESNTFGYQGNEGENGLPTGSGGNTLGQYKFSADEMRVLQDCNRESFFQRSLPMSTALGLGTLAAVQRGVLKGNPRFGPFPKVTLAVAAGYFLGKLSYQRACAEKLMALPGSYIGQLLRDRRDGKHVGGDRPSDTGASGGGMLGAAPADIYSDAGPGSALDLDTERPAYNEDAPPAAAPPAPRLSYDELRSRNRGADARRDPYRVEPSPPPPPRPPAPTNRYGDALD